MAAVVAVAALAWGKSGLALHPRPPPVCITAAAPSSRGHVVIRYCTKCQWALRSAWLAQELLSTFGQGTGADGEVTAVTLVPDASGGVFTIHCDGRLIWDRRDAATPGFPEAKVLKRLVRDELEPGRSLGHSDRP